MRAYSIGNDPEAVKCDSCHEATAVVEIMIGEVDSANYAAEAYCAECLRDMILNIEEELMEATR